MGLILRVDVDKPYGRNTIFEKLKSKLREDFWFPQINSFGYLNPTIAFIKFCNVSKIKGVFYHRNCTLPNQEVINLLKEGSHQLGFHAENTRNLSTFKEELHQFSNKVLGMEVSSFTKHGSGDIKIGKNHYAPYEPELYKLWGKEVNLPYYFGNDISDKKNDFEKIKEFYPKMFWIHREYRKEPLAHLENVIELAKNSDVPIIIHPSNFVSEANVNNDFKRLVILANKASIPWVQK